MPGSAPPVRVRTSPRRSYSGTRLSMTLNTLSTSETSITWPAPWPVLTRSRAIRAPMTPWSEASVSPMLTPTRAGGVLGSPVVKRKPPIDSPMAPKPGRSR